MLMVWGFSCVLATIFFSCIKVTLISASDVLLIFFLLQKNPEGNVAANDSIGRINLPRSAVDPGNKIQLCTE